MPRSAGFERTNLRAPASSFIGRRADLEALARHFEEARLVTLSGPGGMGKTRLALRFAEEQLPTFVRRGAGGVWVLELTLLLDAIVPVRWAAPEVTPGLLRLAAMHDGTFAVMTTHHRGNEYVGSLEVQRFRLCP